MDPVEVAMENTYDADAIRATCPQFRILVIGRANSGKTTILQKVCNVNPDAKPIVYDERGRKIRSSFFRRGTAMRGEHHIEHQITYKDCGFVFHDSCGFESGANEEMQKVKSFLEKRTSQVELRNQLHAIWFCIPMDNDRPLTYAEREFFEYNTGRVPVIVIFTKFDAQIVKTFAKQSAQNIQEAKMLAEEHLYSTYIPLREKG